MTFVFVSFLFLLIFGGFAYPELKKKKREQTNTREGDTHITRDLGILYISGSNRRDNQGKSDK